MNNKIRFITLLGLTAAIVGFFQNCADTNFTSSATNSQNSAAGFPGSGLPGLPGSGTPGAPPSCNQAVCGTIESTCVFDLVYGTNSNNRNLLTDAEAAGWDGTCVPTITAIVSPGVIIGSASTSSAAFVVPAGFPAGANISLVLDASSYIVGAGGNGGGGAAGGGFQYYATTGLNGGPALSVSFPIQLANAGVIGGGGGGGGGGGDFDCNSVDGLEWGGVGGGGAGSTPGNGGQYPAPYSGTNPAFMGQGTAPFTGGAGEHDGAETSGDGPGGNGGGLGQPGQPGSVSACSVTAAAASTGAGGLAGDAIDGKSQITFLNTGSILGSEN